MIGSTPALPELVVRGGVIRIDPVSPPIRSSPPAGVACDCGFNTEAEGVDDAGPSGTMSAGNLFVSDGRIVFAVEEPADEVVLVGPVSSRPRSADAVRTSSVVGFDDTYAAH